MLPKFELEKVLSSILENYGFLDIIEVLNFSLERNNIYGVFKENNLEYNFSLNYNSQKDVEQLSWTVRNA